MNLFKQLIKTVENKTLKQRLKELYKQHYSSDYHKDFGLNSSQRASSGEQRSLSFGLDDFQKKTSPIVEVSVKAVAETNIPSNPYKAMLEASDDQIQKKFDDNAGSAIKFLNDIRAGLGLKDFGGKTFSKSFFETFRATISQKVEEYIKDPDPVDPDFEESIDVD